MKGATTTLAFLTLLTLANSQGCASTPRKTDVAETTPAAAEKITPMRKTAGAMMPMMGGWHHYSPYGQLYFQGKEITLEGEILRIGPVTPMPQMMQGIELQLKTEQGQTAIHLGPSWYIEQQDLTLKIGDKVKVSGRSIGVGTETIVLAAQVQKGAEILTLRDKEGFPYWAGMRMRAMPPQGRGSAPKN
jgi:hypothetical protein